MEVDSEVQGDAFLEFIDYARSLLWPQAEENNELNDQIEEPVPGWGWMAGRIIRTCMAYSSGVTAAILLSDLSQAWSEKKRVAASGKKPECIKPLKKQHQRTKLPNTVTIDSIYKKNFLSLSSVLEAVIIDAYVLPGTNIHMLSLGDFWSSNTIDLFLHRRYYDLVSQTGILRKGREILLTGCHLRTAEEGSGCMRLLPTEYLVILLDEEQDDDAMLLGAQFCSDSFASISMDEGNRGVSYSLYARIESIGLDELIQGGTGSLKRKHITLVDNDGNKLKFLLWGDQILLANLFSTGSMIALDRPYIASSAEGTLDTAEELCLEYGSATQLYLVPFIQHEEHVSVVLSQNRNQGLRLLSMLDHSQAPVVSQVTLPCDSQGSVDFTSYPFQVSASSVQHVICLPRHQLCSFFLPPKIWGRFFSKYMARAAYIRNSILTKGSTKPNNMEL
ncbi:hypothetical protein SAY86_021451 [Trapa natans]|uniref:Uncharacterized protein n=1 Tax=Trapa natans TaxID=22666 RepID=A0AAN7M8Q1_TRANT|nr:hypothetical protein SAY86_021451 [Trapa natans]